MAWHDRRIWAAACAALFVASGCGASPTPRNSPAATSAIPTASPTTVASAPPVVKRIGPGEGVLDIVVRPGYAESGLNDGAYDWVSPFEQDTGCIVNAFEAGTSDQMLTKVVAAPAGTWDGVSAPGDVGVRLITDGRIQPVDVETLFPAWNDLWPPLQSPAHNTVGGLHYGISQGWTANLLMWNTGVVQPGPTSWRAVYEAGAAERGRVTAYDSPISIADAALFLSETNHGLGITDPYELTRPQFDAAVALLKAQRPFIDSYWGTPLDEIGAFSQGDAVIGSAWPDQVHLLQSQDPPIPVKAVLPTEGTTGWADTWMLLSGARHPNCMLRWMAWMVSPQVQKMTAEFVGEAPANLAACGPLDHHHGPLGFADFCTFHHVNDEAFSGLVQFWKTPLSDCGDARGDACVDASEWIQQWDQIKAAG